MKQIDIIKTYSQKRCLVIDVNPDIRTALKRMLVDFGASEIDTAGHAEEAIELCARTPYDIVLTDYNLGKGRNGQQLLEELRFQGLLRNTAVYIIITAESNAQHVIHALEFEPDDYLQKPITREALRPRLDNAMLRNNALQKVNDALDAKNFPAAINACVNVISSTETKYQIDAKKMLGELFCQQGQFNDAFELFRELSNINEAGSSPLWVKLGKAEALIGLKRMDEALELLNDVLKTNPLCVDAHDLMAELHLARHKPGLAQEALYKAVNINSLSAKRQRLLGRVCLELGDENAALHAYRAAIKHSKNTCQEDPEDFANLAEATSILIKKSPDKKDSLNKEALEALGYLDKRYPKHPIVQMRRHLVEEDVHLAANNEKLAKAANQKALDILSNMKISVIENTHPQLCIDCAKDFMDRGLYDEGEYLLQELSNVNKDKKYVLVIDKLLRVPKTKEGIAFAAKLNKRGIEFHKAESFDSAINSFEKGLYELPNHVGLNLNLIQSIIGKSKTQDLSKREIDLMQHSFKRMGNMANDPSHKERYEFLWKRFKRIIDK